MFCVVFFPVVRKFLIKEVLVSQASSLLLINLIASLFTLRSGLTGDVACTPFSCCVIAASPVNGLCIAAG